MLYILEKLDDICGILGRWLDFAERSSGKLRAIYQGRNGGKGDRKTEIKNRSEIYGREWSALINTLGGQPTRLERAL